MSIQEVKSWPDLRPTDPKPHLWDHFVIVALKELIEQLETLQEYLIQE